MQDVLIDVGLISSIVLGMAAFFRLMLRGLGAAAEPACGGIMASADGREWCRVEVAMIVGPGYGVCLAAMDSRGDVFPCDAGVHTSRMRFPIDVAFLDKERRAGCNDDASGRIGRPRLKARSVLEAEAGSFATWGVKVGSHIEIIESGVGEMRHQRILRLVVAGALLMIVAACGSSNVKPLGAKRTTSTSTAVSMSTSTTAKLGPYYYVCRFDEGSDPRCLPGGLGRY